MERCDGYHPHRGRLSWPLQHDGRGPYRRNDLSRSSPHLIIIDHTAVPDALRGKGVGQALAAHAIEEARKGGWKIIPLCPFMRAQTLRHPEWQDVIQA
jgi:predicted GNAT family acetyltransferase